MILFSSSFILFCRGLSLSFSGMLLLFCCFL
nr:MAG TPA: hypothetical protein [Caudoviricetes sp.]